MITKTDKGNTLIILYKNVYNKKVHNFISNNKFHQTASDITNRLQLDITNTVNEYQNIVSKGKRWNSFKSKSHSI
jgi:hypothetical protein